MPSPDLPIAELVETLAGYGTPVPDIARLCRISPEILFRDYGESILDGQAKAKAKLAENIFTQAISGNTALAMFLARAWLGIGKVQNAAEPDDNDDMDFLVISDK